MELSPSWEAANCAATQELPSILWNQKMHCRVHKSPHWSLSSAGLSQSVPPRPISRRSILILFTYLCLGLPSSLFPSGFTTNILYNAHSCHMHYPSHPFWFDHSNYTWQRVQFMKLLIMQFLQPFITSSLFGPNILLNTLFSNTLSLCSSLNVRDQVSQPYRITEQNYVLFCIFQLLCF
jgi:hypothetical protein